ncbi:hypothetical protein H0H93_013484 [Arthromyces matolae]|nr:hypothetical protein H0H93_013484 [Arthromyces matolae]
MALKIDILQWMSRAALEMIGQSGFGYSFDPLVEGAEPHPFCEAAKSFSPTMNKLAIEQHYLLPTLVKIGSPKFRRWFVDHLPIKRLRDVRDVVDTMHRTTVEIFEEKKRVLQAENADGEALKEKVGNAKDLMSILIPRWAESLNGGLIVKANMDASEEDKLPDEEVLGQLLSEPGYMLFRTFAFAATDTTSNALSRTLHLLALHPEAQERLRAEVIEARKVHAGDIPYDDLVSLPFLDAICRETLRLYVLPSVGILVL